MGISKKTTYRRHSCHPATKRSVLSLARKTCQLARKTDAHLSVESITYTGPSYGDSDLDIEQSTDDEFGMESDTEDNLPEILNVCLLI